VCEGGVPEAQKLASGPVRLSEIPTSGPQLARVAECVVGGRVGRAVGAHDSEPSRWSTATGQGTITSSVEAQHGYYQCVFYFH
jgi:hypothetical protein